MRDGHRFALHRRLRPNPNGVRQSSRGRVQRAEEARLSGQPECWPVKAAWVRGLLPEETGSVVVATGTVAKRGRRKSGIASADRGRLVYYQTEWHARQQAAARALREELQDSRAVTIGARAADRDKSAGPSSELSPRKKDGHV